MVAMAGIGAGVRELEAVASLPDPPEPRAGVESDAGIARERRRDLRRSKKRVISEVTD